MNEKDFYTVREFADRAGISLQAVYQQINGRLSPYVIIKKGLTMISADALRAFYGLEQVEQADSSENQADSRQVSSEFNQVIQGDTSQLNQVEQADSREYKLLEDTISVLKSTVETLQTQLQTKDLQIAEKDKQIKDLSDRLGESMDLLKGQQYIHAADKTKDLIEAQTAPSPEPEKPEEVTPVQTDPEPLPKRKSFLSKIKNIFG